MGYPRVVGTAHLTTGADFDTKACSRCGIIRSISGKPADLCRGCRTRDEDTSSKAWVSQAACSDEDSKQFFPLGESSPFDLEMIRDAKAVCARCPVVEECLRDALAGGAHTAYGVWGGLTERERVALKRKSARSAVGRLPKTTRLP